MCSVLTSVWLAALSGCGARNSEARHDNQVHRLYMDIQKIKEDAQAESAELKAQEAAVQREIKEEARAVKMQEMACDCIVSERGCRTSQHAPSSPDTSNVQLSHRTTDMRTTMF